MNPKTARFALFAWILGFCLVVSLPLRAQVTGATISGTVTDASGGVIPGAQVSVRNTATGIIRNTTADSAGFYTVPNLNPGPYEVKVTAKGFTTALQSNLALAVGAQQALNISMKVGETSQTVQVTEAAPQIELTSSALSGQIEGTTVTELPLNGRDWASLATLSPGVNAVEVQMPFETGARRGNRGFGSQLTISGGKPTQNNYRLDGLSINDYANGGPGSVLGVNLGVDAIQEFSVLTGNYSAEYGRASAGIVNAISKSGTNAFHDCLTSATSSAPQREDRSAKIGPSSSATTKGYARRRGSPARMQMFRLTMRAWAYSRARAKLRKTSQLTHHARALAGLPGTICLPWQPFAWMTTPRGTWRSFLKPPSRVRTTASKTPGASSFP